VVQIHENCCKLNVFVGFRSSTQPTNQDIFDFGEGIDIGISLLGCEEISNFSIPHPEAKIPNIY
jgi:hypothetical protein